MILQRNEIILRWQTLGKYVNYSNMGKFLIKKTNHSSGKIFDKNFNKGEVTFS